MLLNLIRFFLTFPIISNNSAKEAFPKPFLNFKSNLNVINKSEKHILQRSKLNFPP